MGLESLSIRNFRGLNELTMSSLSRINLIGGRNNSGKSSILEAVCLLSMRGNASALPEINNVTRRIQLSGRDDLAVAFNNEEYPLVVSARLVNGSSSMVRVNLDTYHEGEISASSNDDGILATSVRWSLNQHAEDMRNNVVARQFDLHLRPQDGKDGKTTFSYTSQKKTDEYDWSCILMSSNSRLDNKANQMFADMMIDLEDKEVSRVISSIYPEIYTIKLVNNELMVRMKDRDRLLPAKAAGDGVVRIISILCGLWSCRNGCLCVDEIDNGLHYSVLLDFWHAVLLFAERYNVQLIATTHHLDALETLIRVCAELDKTKEIAYYRIVVANGDRGLTRFSGENLDRALKMGFEVRG